MRCPGIDDGKAASLETSAIAGDHARATGAGNRRNHEVLGRCGPAGLSA